MPARGPGSGGAAPTRGHWRVEWEDEDTGIEVTIFSGPDARERAIQYADWQYSQFV
jgi:hypothetical protein